MIFINHFGSSQAAMDYHGHLSRGDYFSHDTEYVPRVEGRLAGRMGLEGRFADKDTFAALCKNEHPDTGERITERTREDRRSMTDFTFDVPKSVTLAATCGMPLTGRRLSPLNSYWSAKPRIVSCPINPLAPVTRTLGFAVICRAPRD